MWQKRHLAPGSAAYAQARRVGTDDEKTGSEVRETASQTIQRRWRMRQMTIRLVGACMLAIYGSVAIGETKKRACTPEERTQANERLENINEDKDWSERLVAKHLPFGRHVTRHAAEGGPSNEMMLVQAGYVTLLFNELTGNFYFGIDRNIISRMGHGVSPVVFPKTINLIDC